MTRSLEPAETHPFGRLCANGIKQKYRHSENIHSMNTSLLRASWFALTLLGSIGGSMAATPLVPSSDDQVIEKLAFATARASRPIHAAQPSVSDAVLAAQQAIAQARSAGDTRYWGRAQAILAPWWDQPDAPIAVAILQATVQQGRHEFAAASATLGSALQRDPNNAQAWLTQASLDRLAGRYTQSLRACLAIERAGQPWYAQSCKLETQSLLGQWTTARSGFAALLATAQNAAQSAWVWSLLAESEERAGHASAAADAYQRSLSSDDDLYTRLAYADLLLRTAATQAPAKAQPQLKSVLKVLASLPETDAVLLRRARAMQGLGQTPAWTAIKTTLAEREQALKDRGDDTNLHAREAALAALWLHNDPHRASELALKNLQLQKEPIDWWVALQSAHAAHQAPTVARLQQEIQALGLKDTRLMALSATRSGNVAAMP